MLNATTTDVGEYTVVVKNESGSIQSTARLGVQPRREIELEYQHSQSLRQVSALFFFLSSTLILEPTLRQYLYRLYL